jgi:hypothetical protein
MRSSPAGTPLPIMRLFIALLGLCQAVGGTAQTPRAGLGLEFSGTYQFIAANNVYDDNILDADRNDGIAATLSLVLQDTNSHGRGIGRLGFGLGTGLIWWDEENLLPLFGQLNWYPFIRRTPWLGIHLDRIGIIARYGALIGAWKETDNGQLSGHSFTDLTVRYPFWAQGPRRAWIDLGFGMMMLRGPYQVTENGVSMDSDRAEFIYPQVGIGLAL